MNTPGDRLTPEERALADRLAGEHADAGPGPALDARILAAARAALEAPSAPSPVAALPSGHRAGRTSSRRPRRRWTVGAGITASLLLAVTIAWQLRPQQTAHVLYEGASAPATPPPEPAAAVQQRKQTPAQPAADASPPAPTVRAPAEDAAPVPASPEMAPTPEPALPQAVAPPPPAPKQRAVPRAPSKPQTPSSLERAGAHIEAAPDTAQVRPNATYSPPAPPAPPAPAYAPPPPPPPPAPTVEAFEARTAHTRQQRSNLSAAPPTDQEAAPAALAPLRAADADTVLRSTERSAGLVPVTPAIARQIEEDRQLPPEQWLRRIRLHRFEGQGALARASLAAFVQAYPHRALPDDLRALRP